MCRLRVSRPPNPTNPTHRTPPTAETGELPAFFRATVPKPKVPAGISAQPKARGTERSATPKPSSGGDAPPKGELPSFFRQRVTEPGAGGAASSSEAEDSRSDEAPTGSSAAEPDPSGTPEAEDASESETRVFTSSPVKDFLPSEDEPDDEPRDDSAPSSRSDEPAEATEPESGQDESGDRAND